MKSLELAAIGLAALGRGRSAIAAPAAGLLSVVPDNPAAPSLPASPRPAPRRLDYEIQDDEDEVVSIGSEVGLLQRAGRPPQ